MDHVVFSKQISRIIKRLTNIISIVPNLHSFNKRIVSLQKMLLSSIKHTINLLSTNTTRASLFKSLLKTIQQRIKHHKKVKKMTMKKVSILFNDIDMSMNKYLLDEQTDSPANSNDAPFNSFPAKSSDYTSIMQNIVNSTFSCSFFSDYIFNNDDINKEPNVEKTLFIESILYNQKTEDQ